MSQLMQTFQQFIHSNSPILLAIGDRQDSIQHTLEQAIRPIRLSHYVLRLQGTAELQPRQLTQVLSKHWAATISDRKARLEEQLQDILNGLANHDQSCLLIVDDANTLPLGVLALLAHAATLQHDKKVHLHIILTGRANLSKKFKALYDSPAPELHCPKATTHSPLHRLKNRLTGQRSAPSQQQPADILHMKNIQLTQTPARLAKWQRIAKITTVVLILLVGFIAGWYHTRARHMAVSLRAHTNRWLHSSQLFAAATSYVTPSDLAPTYFYTIQLIGLKEQGALQAYAKKNHLDQNTHILETTSHGKNMYVLVYGHYNTYAAADTALKNLPSQMRQYHPWVRKE